MKIKQLFSFFRFDIFNHQFFLRIGHKNQNSTIFSTIISHLLMITLVVYFIFSSFSTFLHTNPQVNIQDFDVTTRSSVHLSSENFRFAFRFENNLGNSINITNLSNYFDITATYIVQDHDTLKENPVWETQSEISFTFEHCVREKFLDFPEYYQTNLRDAFCLTDHSMDLSGFWDEIKLSYLYITINICDEEDPLCVGRGAIEEMFQGYYLTFYIETQNIDSNNYKNPSKQSMKYYSYIFDTNIKKNVNFYIKEVELKTFDALFFNLNPSSQKFFRQNSLDLDFNSNFINITNNTLNAFWEIYMHSSNQKQVIERTYSTLTAVFASVGGISKFLLMIGTFITLYYNEMKLQSELLNQLFLFNFEENSEVMKNSFRKKRKKNYFEKGKKLVNLGKETPETNILNHKMKKKDLDFSAVNEINLLDYTRNKNEKSLNENELKIDSHEKKSITNLNDLKQLDISKESLANNNLDKHFINLSDEDIKEVANEEFDKEIKFFRIHRAIIGKKTSTNPNISGKYENILKLCLIILKFKI